MPIDSLNRQLPEGIDVHHAELDDPKLKAWYIRVEERRDEISTEVIISDDVDRRETIADLYQQTGAAVVINGGYFRMDLDPANHVGVLRIDGELIQAPTPSVIRGESSFPVNRAAIGFSDSVRIGWISRHNDSLFQWSVPIPNAEGSPGERPSRRFARYWDDGDILGGGPQLIKDGKIDVAWESEVFFGTSIPEVHPRTAAGVTARGDLILLVVDGRQYSSRGVDLQELAHIMVGLGCRQALNLDGGGSSSLMVNGTLLNRPAGDTQLREIMSALAVIVD